MIRGVCREWRDAALHPGLWRTRCVRDDTLFSGNNIEQEPVLKLAPCVDTLMLSTDIALEHYGLLAATTACAAANLTLCVWGCHNVATAALALRNQAALGRLRKVSLSFTEEGLKSGGVADLYMVLHTTEGLEEAEIELEEFSRGLSLPEAAYAPLPDRPAQSSLKQLTYTSGSSDPHLELLLRSHAGSLREVKLVFVNNVPAAVLAGLSSLVHLECPLLDDMPQLLTCPRLTSILLRGRSDPDGTDQAARGARDFLRQATQLRKVQLYAVALPHKKALDVSLVEALAQSGRSEVEHLVLEGTGRPGKKYKPSPCLLRLAAVLPGLPQLRHLQLDAIAPDDFFRAISPASLPALRNLVLRAPDGCTHDWVHGPAVQSVLRRNPLLHLRCLFSRKCEPKQERCKWCLWGCHEVIKTYIFSFHSDCEEEQCSNVQV